jgi:hypothetical protein
MRLIASATKRRDAVVGVFGLPGRAKVGRWPGWTPRSKACSARVVAG